MTDIYQYLHTPISFIIIISVIVFIHELGHYLVAKWSGVKIETFSIGFGREIWGFNDSSGTRWKFALIPLGGYVKMFGDAGAASNPDNDLLKNMTEEEKKVAFNFQPLLNKALIVVAGPVANFILAILILTVLFTFWGRSEIPAKVGKVLPDSAAMAAGLKENDVIVEIDGESIKRFPDIQSVVSISRGAPLNFKILRENNVIDVVVTPQVVESSDVFGNKTKLGRIGIAPPEGEIRFEKLSPPEAVKASFVETYTICVRTLQAMKQMVTGERSSSELSGIIRIGKYAGQATERGVSVTLWFMALLSVNLGLINLFPIPMLDGGHLFFYGIEAVRGKPLNEKFQEYCFRFGMALLVALMGFALFNDIRTEWLQ